MLYSQKGYKGLTTSDIGVAALEHAERLNYLTIALAMAYTLRSDGQGFQMFAGPYVSVLLSGRYDLTVTPQNGAADSYGGAIIPVSSEPVTFGSYAQRFDAGLQAGLGYRYQGLLFQAGYSLGLRNVAVYSLYSASAINKDHYNRAWVTAGAEWSYR